MVESKVMFHNFPREMYHENSGSGNAVDQFNVSNVSLGYLYIYVRNKVIFTSVLLNTKQCYSVSCHCKAMHAQCPMCSIMSVLENTLDTLEDTLC